MKQTCEIIRDLLPLYRDGVCSAESREAVEAHLETCVACREELRLMEARWDAPQASGAELDSRRAAVRAWRRALLRGGLMMLALILLCVACYVGWHCYSTLPETDLEGLAAQAAEYLGGGPLTVERTERRGDYLAALCVDERGFRCICIFDRDRLFKDRWYANGGTFWMEPGELGVWNFGSPARESVLAFGGGDLPAEARWYTFTSGGITHFCPVEDDSLLGLFVIPDGRGSTSTAPILLDENYRPLD